MDAITLALDQLVRAGGAIPGAEDRAALLTSLVGLAIKRASVLEMLTAVNNLLAFGCELSPNPSPCDGADGESLSSRRKTVKPTLFTKSSF